MDACIEAKRKESKNLEYDIQRKFYTLQDRSLLKEESNLSYKAKNKHQRKFSGNSTEIEGTLDNIDLFDNSPKSDTSITSSEGATKKVGQN